MGNRLSALTLKGFKTIRELSDFELGPLTVLIGANGAGKSNLVSFFRMMAWALGGRDGLQDHVARLGGASALLHDGPARTREVEALLTITTDAGENQYAFRLVYAAGDTLIYADERFRFSRHGVPTKAAWTQMGAGHRGPKLMEFADAGNQTARVILRLLRMVRVYQFHDTSMTARMRSKWDAEDNRYLKEDAANIAPFLLRLRDSERKSYQRIVDTVRLVMPFFADFELEPEYGKVLLKWRERNSDVVFNASQAADGMLRTFALVALLLQPEQDLPDVLVLDEPELGLHPYAIELVGGLVRGISTNRQVVIATQSTRLVDCFDPEAIVVVDRTDRESRFRRLDRKALGEWLDEYSLSELWEKNVIGGRP